MARNYRKEYDKFQDSPSAIRRRTQLNRLNYKKGTYGNEDGLDVSHTKNGTKLESSSVNKGKKEKSRLKGSKRKMQEGGKTFYQSFKSAGFDKAMAENKRKAKMTDAERIADYKKRRAVKAKKDSARTMQGIPEDYQAKIRALKERMSNRQAGGYLKGPSHKNGGIAAVVGGQEPVELEGGEYIIKKSSANKLGKKTLDELNKKGRIPTMAKGGKTKKRGMGQALPELKPAFHPETGERISKRELKKWQGEYGTKEMDVQGMLVPAAPESTRRKGRKVREGLPVETKSKPKKKPKKEMKHPVFPWLGLDRVPTAARGGKITIDDLPISDAEKKRLKKGSAKYKKKKKPTTLKQEKHPIFPWLTMDRVPTAAKGGKTDRFKKDIPIKKGKGSKSWMTEDRKVFDPKNIKTMREIMLEQAGLPPDEKKIKAKLTKKKAKGGKIKKYKKGDKVKSYMSQAWEKMQHAKVDPISKSHFLSDEPVDFEKIRKTKDYSGETESPEEPGYYEGDTPAPIERKHRRQDPLSLEAAQGEYKKLQKEKKLSRQKKQKLRDAQGEYEYLKSLEQKSLRDKEKKITAEGKDVPESGKYIEPKGMSDREKQEMIKAEKQKKFTARQKKMTGEFGEEGGKKKVVVKKDPVKKKVGWFDPATGKEYTSKAAFEKSKVKTTTEKAKSKKRPSKFTKLSSKEQAKLSVSEQRGYLAESKKREKSVAKKAKKTKFRTKWIPWSKEAKALRAKKKAKEDTSPEGLARSYKERMKKKYKLKQYGGQIKPPMGANQVNPENPMNPTSSIPARPPFRQGMRMMGHGGVTSVTNDKAGAGDVATVHSHSGYKAGE